MSYSDSPHVWTFCNDICQIVTLAAVASAVAFAAFDATWWSPLGNDSDRTAVLVFLHFAAMFAWPIRAAARSERPRG